MLSRLFAAVGVLIFAGASAHATHIHEYDISDARGERAMFRSGGGIVRAVPSVGLLTMPDPRCPTESSLQIHAGGSLATFELPCQNWQFLGSRYQYMDPRGQEGGIMRLVWVSRGLIVRFNEAYPLSLPVAVPDEGIQVRLNVADRSYCGRFEPQINQGHLLFSREAVPCDALPTHTPTHTFTPTPTSTPTSTPTDTPPGPTNTPTHTPTSTNTPTDTPVPTPPPQVALTSPVHGTFIDPDNQLFLAVSGVVTNQLPGQELVVNGQLVGVDPNDGTFDTILRLDEVPIFNAVLAELSVPATGFATRDRRVVIYGDSVPDSTAPYPTGGSESTRQGAGFSTQSIALRINDTGFDVLEPTVANLVDFDPAVLLPVGTELDVDGIKKVVVINPPPSIDGFGLAIDSMINFVGGDVEILGFEINLEVTDDPFLFDITCDVRITVDDIDIIGDYTLDPDPVTPSNIDVNLVPSSLNVVQTGFNHTFTSGTCDFFSGIINAFIGDIEGDFRNALQDFLDDPDGAGSQDSPVADAIEDALMEVEIAGPIGAQLGLTVEAPIVDIPEDNNGITLNNDARMTAPAVAPGAPDLTASLEIPSSFPSFGTTTPVSGDPYHLALCVGASSFNQLLKGITEAGQLNTTLTELDLGGGPAPITAGLLTVFLPELSVFDPSTPMKIDLIPTIAPVVNGEPGPSGELAKLLISHMGVELSTCEGGDPDVCEPATDSFTLVLGGATDVLVGFNLALDEGPPAGMLFQLTEPAVDDIGLVILENPLGLDEALIVDILPPIFAPLLPTLGDAFGSIPVPSFFGLNACFVEASRNGDFLSLFLNLSSAPCP